MRINAKSLRLGYTSYWTNNDPTNDSRFYYSIKSYVYSVFQNRCFKNFLLCSDLRFGRNRYSNLINIYLFPYRTKHLKFNKKNKFKKKYIKYVKSLTLVNSIINTDIYSILNNKFSIRYILVSRRFFNSDILSKYITSKLIGRFKINKILSDIKKYYGKRYNIIMNCSGRFDRKERASSATRKIGKLSLNTVSNRVQYSQASVILKYGVCGVKVWVLKK